VNVVSPLMFAEEFFLSLALPAQSKADAAIFVHGLVHAGDHADSSPALDSISNIVSPT
jgi:hypothetical protein